VAVTYEQVKAVAAELYGRAIKTVPEDTKAALVHARETETNLVAQNVLSMMLGSACRAEEADCYLCSDTGIPTYFVRIGTAVRLDGNIRQAISDGYDHLVATIEPPLLQHVNNPLTLARGWTGKGMPLVTFDLVDGADYVEIVCSPKGLGSGRWAALEIFTFPTLDVIERYIMDCVLKAGGQHCPPTVIGVGIGGTFDYCAKLAKQATLRPFGEVNPEPILADMEARLLAAVNKTGFGPMGTGGDTTALAVHIDYAASHGFVPVAVCFNCWVNRRSSARLYDDGRIERFD
jgi:fumarate hydratase subunit alpha